MIVEYTGEGVRVGRVRGEDRRCGMGEVKVRM